MSGNSPIVVLDTNVILYHLSNRLKKPLGMGQYAISSITELELLSYPKIQEKARRSIQEFIDRTTIIELQNPVKQNTVFLRRKYTLKLPDAIIAATALWLEVPLLTNDKKLFNIAEIETLEVEVA